MVSTSKHLFAPVFECRSNFEELPLRQKHSQSCPNQSKHLCLYFNRCCCEESVESSLITATVTNRGPNAIGHIKKPIGRGDKLQIMVITVMASKVSVVMCEVVVDCDDSCSNV